MAYPWVDLSTEESQSLNRKMQDISEERDILLAKYDELSDFYRNREFNFDKRIVVTGLGSSYRIMSQGGLFQEGRKEKESEIRLKEYQTEMQDFNSFLKSNLP